MKLQLLDNGKPRGNRIDILLKAEGDKITIPTGYGDIIITCTYAAGGPPNNNAYTSQFGDWHQRAYMVDFNLTRQGELQGYSWQLSNHIIEKHGPNGGSAPDKDEEEIVYSWRNIRTQPSTEDFLDYGQSEYYNYYAQPIFSAYDIFSSVEMILEVDLKLRPLSFTKLPISSHRGLVTGINPQKILRNE